MKMSKKDSNMLLAALGIILAAGSVFWGNSLSTKTQTLEGENTVLEGEVAYLQDLTNHKQEYLDEMDRMNQEMDNIKEQFPADIYPENQIMYTNGLESQFEVLLDSIDMPGITSVEVVAPIAQATTATTNTASTTDTTATTDATATAATTTTTTTASSSVTSILLSEASTTVGYQASYSGLKNMIKYLNEDKERKSVETLTVSYDAETGNLRGTLAFNMYALSGTGKEYVPPVVTGVTDGKTAIFSGATVLNRSSENRTGDAATADGIAADSAEDNAAEDEDAEGTKKE